MNKIVAVLEEIAIILCIIVLVLSHNLPLVYKLVSPPLFVLIPILLILLFFQKKED